MSILSLLILLAPNTRESLPRYLTDQQVLSIVQKANFEGCFSDHESKQLKLEISIGRGGKVENTKLEPEAQTTCINDIVNALSFPDHDGSVETWEYTIVWTGNEVVPYPTIQRKPKNQAPLLIILDEQNQIRVEQAIGIDLYP